MEPNSHRSDFMGKGGPLDPALLRYQDVHRSEKVWDRKVYIVYMGSLPKNQQYEPSSHHVSLVQKVTGESFSEKLIVASYGRSFNGFAAKLTCDEAEELSKEEGVFSVFPERMYQLSTTRPWDFLAVGPEKSKTEAGDSRATGGIVNLNGEKK